LSTNGRTSIRRCRHAVAPRITEQGAVGELIGAPGHHAGAVQVLARAALPAVLER
jgi:hypothetical protein